MEPIGTVGSTRTARFQGTTPLPSSDGNAFEAALARAVGEFDKASARTTSLIRDLWENQGIVAARPENGGDRVLVGDIAANRDDLLQKLTMAADSLFADYGIDTRQAITFAVGQDGRITVVEPHPQKARIEELVNQSRMLRNSIVKVMNDSRLLAEVEGHGSSGAEGLSKAADAMLLTFCNTGKGLTGAVQVGGTTLARTDKDDESPASAERRVGKPIGELLDELAGLT